jgi:transposase
MPRSAPPITLSDSDRKSLLSIVRAATSSQRDVFRARIVLRAADGLPSLEISEELGTRPATVAQWRGRFARMGMAGLVDGPRPGKKPVYTGETEQRILAKLDEKPPTGYALWNGRLIAEALGDVSDDQVWRVLRKHGISLEKRRSWCVSTDPEFARKAADIVGLYMNPPENALVLCVDEKPSIQALERAQGYLKLPNGKALMGFSHDYTCHGTTTLFAALEIATGQVTAGHYKRRRRREFLDFMNEVVAANKGRQIHVVLDNLNTHKPKNDQWLRRHPNVRFHFTPTHASWMNMVEVWFSILSRGALRGASFTSPGQVRQAIDDFVAAYNPTASPFEWTKREVGPKSLKNNYGKSRK